MHLADRIGLSSLSRRKSSLSYLTAGYIQKGKDMPDEDIVPKNPSVAEEEVEILPEEFYNKPLLLEKVPLLSQRLCQPDFQPAAIRDLYPRHKHLLAKRSQRCRECEHNLSKPEFNPSSIKFKIQLGAIHYIPLLRISSVPHLRFGKEVQVTLSLTNPIDSIVKVTFIKVEEADSSSSKEGDNQDSQSEKTDTKGDDDKESADAKDNEEKNSDVKDQTKQEKGKEEKRDLEQEKNEKTAKEDKTVGSMLLKKPSRNLDNTCESKSFVPTAEVTLPTYPLVLGARDEAAEFDEMETQTEMFNDDPRVVVNRQANKLWFLVKVFPKKSLGDVKFVMLMQYDYKHVSTTLVRGSQESEEQVATLRHKLHINLGPVDPNA